MAFMNYLTPCFFLIIVRFNKKPRICGAFYILFFITIMEEELVQEPEPQVQEVLAEQL